MTFRRMYCRVPFLAVFYAAAPGLSGQSGPVEEDPRMVALKRAAIPLATIDPAVDDQSDLESLTALFAGRRAVLLGEATHGSGSDFLAKARLVRFLHERLGFDVLAFESPACGMRLAWDSILAGSIPVEAAFARGAFGHYVTPVQMEPLFAYLERTRATDNPLRVAGFDNQSLLRGLVRFAEDLERFMEARGISNPLRSAGSGERAVLESLSIGAFRRDDEPLPSPDRRARFLTAINALRDALGAHGDPESRWWGMILQGTGCHALRAFALAAGEGELSGACARNAQMARQAVWLLEEDPDARVVYWAHNAHVMQFGEEPIAESEFGEMLQEALGREAYTIVTSSFEGTHGFASAPPARIVENQVDEVEFEELLATTGWPAAIVPLSRADSPDSWPAQRFFARPIAYEAESQPWARRVDAFLFIRTQEKAR